MLFLLSPAKKLDFDSALPVEVEATQPLFVEQAKELIDDLQELSQEDIAGLMKLSDALASLNYDRYQEWEPKFDETNSRPAIYAFNGDVYEGLQAQSFNKTELALAQEHILMLSGLYGALRPLDLMRPYRLEMGTKLQTAKGKNLYEFWGSQISDYINQRLAHHKSQVVINLASQEYFKSVDLKALDYPVVECVFQEKRNGEYKIISFNAKKARGYMARFAIENKVKTVDDLKGFDTEGYRFDKSASSDSKLVFRKD